MGATDGRHDEERRAVEVARAITGQLVEEASPLTGGEVNAAYRVRTASEDLVVRWVRGERASWHPDLAGEVAAMRLAATIGVPCPVVRFYDDEVLVTDYIEGAPMTEQQAASGLALEAGRLFGQLHAHIGRGCGPVQADGSDPGWPTNVFTQSVASEAEEVLARAERLPAELDPSDVATAAELVEGLDLPLRARLVHGDASLTNTLVADDKVVAILDFEVAWLADPAIDLAWWWWNSPATAGDFQRGCTEASETTDERRLWLHRLRLLIGLAHAFAHVDVSRAARIGRLLRVAIDRANDLG
ncbi:MAG TPA: phosphotransferase [Acidimicrobiales bacterium]|nr:phosphotransferase [Acidimicrobiales bacterium]